MTIVFLSFTAHSQVSVNVNIGPPAWGPEGYSGVEYYYLPDVEAYYDVETGMFIYLDGGVWRRHHHLAGRYRDYDLYSGYKVVMTGYHGDRPYDNFNEYRVKYAKGYHGETQRTIGTRPANNHPVASAPARSHATPNSPARSQSHPAANAPARSHQAVSAPARSQSHSVPSGHSNAGAPARSHSAPSAPARTHTTESTPARSHPTEGGAHQSNTHSQAAPKSARPSAPKSQPHGNEESHGGEKGK